MEDKDKSDRRISLDNDLTPIHIASWLGDVKTLNRCINTYKNVNVKDKDGRTPLHLATTQGFYDVVNILLKNGAKVNILDNENHHPIFKAIEQGHIDIVRKLIEADSDLSIIDDLGDTVLHTAIKSNNIDIASLLIEYMNDTDITNYQGETPLTLAKSANLNDIKEKLSKKKSQNSFDIFRKKGKEKHVIKEMTATSQTNNSISKNKKKLSSVNEEFSDETAIETIKPPKYKRSEIRENNETDEYASVADTISEENAHEISQIMDEMICLSNRLGSVRSILKQMKILKDNYKSKVDAIQINLSREQLEKNEIEKQLNNLRNSIYFMQDEEKASLFSIQQMQVEMDALRKRLNEEKEAYENLKSFIEKLKDNEAELFVRINNIEQELRDTRTEKSGKDSDNNYLRNQIHILKTEMQNRIKDDDEWEKKLIAIRNERQNFQRQINLLDKDMKISQRSLEDNMRTTESKLQVLANEKYSLEKKLKEEIRRKSSTEKKIALGQQELQELNGKFVQLKKQTDQIQRAIEEQSRSHCNTEKTFRAKVEKLRAENHNLYEQVNELRLRLHQTESKLEKEHIQSNQIIADLRENLQNFKSQHYKNNMENHDTMNNAILSVKDLENVTEISKSPEYHERIHRKKFFHYLKPKTRSEESKTD